MDPATTLEALRYLRWPEVKRLTGLSRTTVWRLERAGLFPRHCKLAAGAVGWIEQEIAEWMRQRRDERASLAS